MRSCRWWPLGHRGSVGPGQQRHAVLQNQFPDILAVIQVALEGSISRESAQTALAAGQLPHGDLLPWMIGQQFQDNRFPSLSGARIVRIATHPSILGAGYGSRAIQELCRYYEGQVTRAPPRPMPGLPACARHHECRFGHLRTPHRLNLFALLSVWRAERW